jgi:hypothetical protein
LASKKTARRKACRERKWLKDLRTYEHTDFGGMTQAEFIAAVIHIALRKVKERATVKHAFGMETERRFFCAFRVPNIELPSWFHGVRRASVSEDNAGIDAFVITDIGEIPVQIKSSVNGMFEFNKKHPGNQIPVLVISRDLSAAQILQKAIEIVSRERDYQRNKRRGGSCNP